MVPAPATHARKPRRLLWALLALAAIVVALLVPSPFSNPAPADLHPLRLHVPLPEGASAYYDLAISPDGGHLAYTVTKAGEVELWLHDLTGDTAQLLASTGIWGAPFWSPDSRFLAFFADRKLKWVDVSRKITQTVCDLPGTRPKGGTWSRTGTILFSMRDSESLGLYRVSPSGGDAVLLPASREAAQQTERAWPVFLEDGQHFLFVEEDSIYLGSLDPDKATRLGKTDTRFVYAPQGYLLFTREGSLLAQPFDATELRVRGEPVPIIDRVDNYAGPDLAPFSVSTNGVLAYGASLSAPSRLRWFDRGGHESGLVSEARAYHTTSVGPIFRLSPDGEQVVATVVDPSTSTKHLWVFELSRNVSTRFTDGELNELYPVWSPDGRRILFGFDYSPPRLHWKTLGSEGNGEPVFGPDGPPQIAEDWSRDGRFVLYHEIDARTGRDLWVAPVSGDRRPIPVARTPSEEVLGRFSPDGRWIVYVSDESGRREVFLKPFRPRADEQEPRGRIQVSTDGGDWPAWRGDGRELFYRRGDGMLVAVPMTLGEQARLGTPEELFELPPTSYDAADDGQRFLVQTPVEAPSWTVVINWPALLER